MAVRTNTWNLKRVTTFCACWFCCCAGFPNLQGSAGIPWEGELPVCPLLSREPTQISEPRWLRGRAEKLGQRVFMLPLSPLLPPCLTVETCARVCECVCGGDFPTCAHAQGFWISRAKAWAHLFLAVTRRRVVSLDLSL